ncbi:MAG: hypothetical protein U0792_15905 [Gemmataceae bacterium]
MRSICLVLFLLMPSAAFGQFTTTREPERDHVRATADLPASQHKRNAAGSDGLGLCVYTSTWHAALWQSVSELYGFRDWMTHKPGGSYPEKFEATLSAYCKERGIPCPGYVQHTGGDADFLALALKTGRMVCVTYCGVDGPGRYGNAVIGHMVNLVHLDEQRAAILDNNFPGTWLWMSRGDFLARWRGVQPDGRPFLARDGRGRAMPIGGGWAIVLLQSPPPPYPTEGVASDEGRGVSQIQQCPNGECPLLAPSQGVWLANTNGREWGFWVNGKCVAAAFRDGHVEATNEHGIATGVRITPPAPLPSSLTTKHVRVEPPATEEPFPQGGVLPERLTSVTRYWRNGERCTKDEAHSALRLADDSERWNLTIVGEPDFTRHVRDDLATLPAAMRAKLHIQSYLPTDWQISQFKLAPGVTLRKSAVGRLGAELGTVSVADYSAARLGELLRPLAQPGPAPVPTPPPNVEPAPAPRSPAQPSNSPTSAGGFILFAVLTALAYLIFRR